MKVAYFIIATHNYIQFINPLLASLRQYFMKGHEVHYFIFTNHLNCNYGPDTTAINIEHKPFPYPTLMRYHIILDHKELYKDYDFFWYSDADMLIIKEIGDEIISDITATEHPGYYNKPSNTFTYETRYQSSAYIDKRCGKRYYAGGFNGGKKYLQMANEIKKLIDIDQKKGIVAIWHDESYLNKYLFMYEPNKILTPSYCFPEDDGYLYPNLTGTNIICDIKVLALKKDYNIRK